MEVFFCHVSRFIRKAHSFCLTDRLRACVGNSDKYVHVQYSTKFIPAPVDRTSAMPGCTLTPCYAITTHGTLKADYKLTLYPAISGILT